MSLFVRRAPACLLGILFSLASFTAGAAHTDHAPIPDAVVQKLVKQPASAAPSFAETLNKDLDDLAEIARPVAERAARALSASEQKSAGESQRMLAAGKRAELAGLRSQAREEFGKTRQRLVALGLAGKVKAWDGLLANAEQRFDRLDKALVDVDVADGNGRQRAFRHLQAELKAVRGDEAARNMGVGELPGPTFRHDVTPVARPVEPSNQLPKYLASRAPANNVYAFLGNTLLAAVPATPPEAVSCGYVKTQDLAATADAPQTTQIQKLAEQLGYSPARIFEYVSNNIQFEPYYGSLKGAMGALNTKAGGPTDQASLLIALLRASNIPARYVRGTVKITDPSPTSPAADGGRMARWVGAKSYAGAAAILAAGKFNTTLFHNSALQNNAVQFQHVWVEACVPYGRYRGAAVDNSGERWIPLDPSFKDKSYQAGIATSVSFDYPGYLAARTNGPDSLPQEAYAQQVQTIVRNANPDATVGDVPYKGTQNPLTVDILPASLPFEVVNFTNWPSTTSPEAYQLPPDHRYRFSISGLGLASPYNLYLPDVALSRVTLSFKGATQGDQTLLDAWRTDNNTSSAIPLCNTVSVVPVLRVEGQDKGISGAAVDLCSTKNALSLSVFLDEFSGTAQTVNYNNIGAANLLALQGYAFQGSDAVLAQRAAILLANVNNTPNPNATADTLDSTEGEFLNLVGLKYMRYISDAAKKVGGINGGSGESGNHMGLASSQIKVQYLFDLPFAVNRAGFLVDMPGVISRDVDLSTGSPVWATFKLAGYAGSAYEAYVWQENAHLDAVSTIRGLQYANEPVQNIGNVIINSANWSSVRPLLSVYPGATADDCSYSLATLQYPRCMIDSPNTTDTTKPVGILGLVNLGYSITLPKSLIQYGDWKGYVFASERSVANPSDTICNGVFCASYAINKLSGGATINTLISSLFSPTLNTGFYATQESPAYLQQISNPFGGTNNSTLANGPPVTAGGDPVNMASGNMYHTERDITIKGRGGLPMVFERSYNSRQPVDGPLGYGWTHSFNHSLKFYGVEGGAAKVSWIDGTGAEKFFATTGQTGGNLAVGVIPSPAGVFVTFQRKADGSYTLREKNGLTYQFETATGPSGVPGPATIPVTARLQSITDRNGNALNLSYSASCGNNLCSVTDALGHALTFTYVGSHLTQIQDFTGRQYQYGYTDGSGNLTSFKNPLSVANATTLPPVTYSYYTSVDGTSLNHLMKQYILPRRNGMKFEYYANGRTFRHTVVNTDGSLSADQINSFAYNDFRRESFQVNERGLERHFFFDPNGNPLKIVEENGAEHSYQYNQSGQPFSRTAKTDPQGLFTQYAYDASGNVTQITTPRNATVKFFDFTAYNQPRRIQDARGNWTILRYDPAGNLSDSIRTVATYTPSTCSGECAIPAAAQILSWSVNGYDNHGNLTSSKRVRDFAGQIANNTPTSTTGPIVAYTFDANQLNATTVARTGIKNTDASPSTQSAALGYDPLGRLITGIDTDWYPTSFTYDTVDRIIQATDRLGKLRDYQFDANGNPVGQKLKVDLYGTQTLVDSSAARYDDADRLQAATDAGGNVTGYSYDATGNVVSVTNPDNYSIGIGYDAANRAVLAYDQENNAVSSSRDADGKVRSITDPNGNTVSNTYWDATRDGRLKTVSSPAIQSYTSGRTLQYDYDENGNVTSLTEIPAGGSGLSNRATTSQYDELNRPTRIVGPQYTDAAFGAVCPVTVYSYDSLSRRTQVKAGYTPSPCTSAAADITKVQETLAFDDFNRKTRSTDALGKFWSIVYDANNNATSVSDAKNQITSFTWDTGHQLLSRTEQGGRKTTYQRNVLGQLIQTVHPEATTTFGYDNTHRLASVIDSRGLKNLSYSWSPGGLLNHLTDSDGRITSYLYDPVGRLAGVTAPNNDTVTYRFDAGGRLTERWLANNASARYAYNADNSLKQLVNRNTASTILSQHDYTYDGVGNRASQTENIGGSTLNYAYSYDELKRLTQVTNGTAAQQENDSYDPWNNRTLKSIGNPVTSTLAYKYDNVNQLTEIHNGTLTGTLQATLGYDNNGNLQSDGTRSYTWDALNQLAQVTKGATTVAYGYDADGKRIRKATGGVTTQWLYDGQDIYAEYGATWTNPNAVYTSGGSVDDPVIKAAVTGTATYGQAQYYHADGLGSVVGLSNSTDTTTQTERFDAWGNKIAGTIPQSAQYGYTGREPDETGLTYYRARFYDPSIARFVSRDPIGLQGGINQYTYVGNNPINLIDPLGLLASEPALPGDNMIACAPICTGLGMIPGRAATAGLAGGTPGYRGLQQQKPNGSDGYQGLLGDQQSSIPPFTAQQIGNAIGGFVNGAIDGATNLGNLIFNQGGSGNVDGALPNAEHAVIDPQKLTGYALNPDHPVGGNKAVVFGSALGYNQSNAGDLISQVQKGVTQNPVTLGNADQFGHRYTVDMPITGPNGNTANVRTGWIIDSGSTVPRLTTIYVK